MVGEKESMSRFCLLYSIGHLAVLNCFSTLIGNLLQFPVIFNFKVSET